jgi:gliding motility-associated-like protein
MKPNILVILLLSLLVGSSAWGLTAGFTATPTSGCAPLVVSFHNTTTPTTGTSYVWTFGPTSSSTGTDPSTSFTTPGTHVVTLTATNGSAVSTYTLAVTVYPPPVVNFTASDTTVCPGTPVTFTSTSTGSVPGPMTYSWNWGDGSPTGTGATATHTFPGPGDYTVTLFVTNSTGCVASLVRNLYIHVYTPPIANFTWSPFGVCNPPGTVTFSSSSSGTPPLTCAWSFGGTGTPASVTYSTPGTYNNTLIVTDGNGCKDTVTLGPVVVDVINAAFGCPTIGCLYTYISFPNTSTGHISRVWNYGDGSPPETIFNGSHAYSAPGTYTVTLTISNPPCTHTVTHTITIVPGPVADFTISPDDPCPAPVSVTYTATGPAGTVYNWLFESGSGAGNPVSHAYGSNGVKTITMIAIDPVTGCRDTVVKTDIIRDLKVIGHATPMAGCKPLPVNFTRDVITTIPPPGGTYPIPVTSTTWDFGDGTPTGSGATTSHTYTDIGTYLVRVTVVTANGCTEWDTLVIQVGAPPVVSFTASPLHLCYGAHVPVIFTPTIISGPVDRWVWNFGDDGLTVDDSTAPPSIVPHTYTLPGLFTVVVTPYYHGCPGTPYSITDYVLIDSPKAIIQWSPLCVPRTSVQFGDSSLGDDTHLWMFGDGTTSTLDNPLHDYPALSVYTVKLATYNINSGCRDTATVTLDLAPPTFTVTANDSSICKYDSITFNITFSSGSGSDFGWALWLPYPTGLVPEPPSTGPPPSFTYGHRFYTSGLHTLSVGFTDGLGCPDSAVFINMITVGKPVPDFTAFPVSGCVPLNVIFTDGSTPAGGTTLSSYEWDFGDGTPPTTVSTPITVHTYTAAGVYDIGEIVTDNLGCKDTTARPAYITAYDPIAAFSANNVHPCLYAPVTFTNTSSGGIVYSHWDFGDGDTSNVTSPSHFYTTLGTYTVKLTVYDSHGCSKTVVSPGLINVTKPTAAFSMSDSVSVCPPLFVNFINTSIGAATQAWDFGDGGTSAVVSPSNMYILSGFYPVQLIVTSTWGCKDTVTHPVNIFGYAGAFSYLPLQGCAPLAVHFTATLSNVPFITWDFSDGVTVTATFSDTITHIYTVPGAYVPKLILSDNTGCQTSSTGLDTIKVDAIYPKMSTNPSPVCIGIPFNFIDSSTSFWSPIDTWEWTYDGNTSNLPSPTYMIGTPGTYPVTLKVTNGWGCVGLMTSTFVINPPPDVTASHDTVVCETDPATLYGYGAATYTWSPPPTLSCTACNPTFATPTVPTTYTVTGTDANGCVDSAEVTVSLRTHTISKAWGDTAVCAGVPVPLFDTGGTSYLWLPPLGLSSNTIYNPIATPPYTTIYTVIARLGSCIPDTNQVTLLIWPLPTVDAGPDQRLLAGSTAQLHATGTDIASLTWWPGETLSCTDCFNPVASMTVMTTYNVDVVSDRGCKASDSVRILLYCDNSMIFIPNAFTPNGDGQNDVLYPRGMGLKTVKTFRIYNRWGELLYENENFNLNDATRGWDGSYKGSTPRPDVYVYILEGVCYTGEDVHIKGDVTIIR